MFKAIKKFFVNESASPQEKMQAFVNAANNGRKEAQDFWAVVKFKEENGIELTPDELKRKAETEQRVEKIYAESEQKRLNDIDRARDIVSCTLEISEVNVAHAAFKDALFTLKQGIQVPLTDQKRKEWFDILAALFIRMTWKESISYDCKFKLIPKSFIEHNGYDIVHFALLHIINDSYYEEFGERYDERAMAYHWSDDLLYDSFTEDMSFEAIEAMFSAFCQYVLSVSNSAFTKEKQAEWHRALTMTMAEVAHTKRSTFFIKETSK